MRLFALCVALSTSFSYDQEFPTTGHKRYGNSDELAVRLYSMAHLRFHVDICYIRKHQVRNSKNVAETAAANHRQHKVTKSKATQPAGCNQVARSFEFKFSQFLGLYAINYIRYKTSCRNTFCHYRVTLLMLRQCYPSVRSSVRRTRDLSKWLDGSSCFWNGGLLFGLSSILLRIYSTRVFHYFRHFRQQPYQVADNIKRLSSFTALCICFLLFYVL